MKKNTNQISPIISWATRLMLVSFLLVMFSSQSFSQGFHKHPAFWNDSIQFSHGGHDSVPPHDSFPPPPPPPHHNWNDSGHVIIWHDTIAPPPHDSFPRPPHDSIAPPPPPPHKWNDSTHIVNWHDSVPPPPHDSFPPPPPHDSFPPFPHDSFPPPPPPHDSTGGGCDTTKGHRSEINIEGMSSTSVTVYPNPVVDNAVIHIQNSNSGTLTFLMFETTGKIVMRSVNLSNGDYSFNKSGLSAGLYIYQVFDGNNKITTGKLIIQ